MYLVAERTEERAVGVRNSVSKKFFTMGMSSGTLPFKSIIHVAGINMLWRSLERSIRNFVRNAIAAAQDRGCKSIALLLFAVGSGGGKAAKVQSIIEDELTKCQFECRY